MEGIESSKNETTLAWRLEPEDSFSDWKIVITSESSRNGIDDKTSEETGAIIGIYHVHKGTMGVGPRSSKYFFRLFKTKGLKEAETSTSDITLKPSAATAFPLMLDFMYAHPAVLDDNATEQTAVALRNLGIYFDIPALIEYVNKFIEDNMDTDNIHIYAEEASSFQDEELIHNTMKCAAPSWRKLYASDDGEVQKQSKYTDTLSDLHKLEALELSMLHVGPDVKKLEQELRQTNIKVVQAQNELADYREKFLQAQNDLAKYVRVSSANLDRFDGYYATINGKDQTLFYKK